jgi:hypothetical protein
MGDPLQWPSGHDLVDWLGSQGFHYSDDHGIVAGKSSSDDTIATITPQVYWQASARWALLNKYGVLPSSLNNRYKIVDGWKRVLELSNHDITLIQETWNEFGVTTTSSTPSSSSNAPPTSELNELLTTSKSHGKQLKWSFLLCGNACQFKLHAHANIELIYCAKGALHEIRMDGAPVELEVSTQVQGKCPSLLSLQRKWSFATLHQGEWLVNEVGSVHKSFTATNGEGCVLLVLWSGSHWNVAEGEEPTSVNVEEAVNHMDERLQSCSDCTEWDTVQEVFLPASEKSNKP